MKNFHLGSFVLGMLATLFTVGALFGGATMALAEWNLGGIADKAKAIAKAATSLVQVKQNLDKDVSNLTADAKTLLGDKENLMSIKDQLQGLATKTRDQIDSISKLVTVVEGHIKSTQDNIALTAKHVSGVDAVRKDLTSLK